MANGSEETWLGRKLLDDIATAYGTVWDLYLRFYTLFLTFSIGALGLTVQYVKREDRKVIVWVFAIQNVLCAITALKIADFSAVSMEMDAVRQEAIAANNQSIHGRALNALADGVDIPVLYARSAALLERRPLYPELQAFPSFGD